MKTKTLMLCDFDGTVSTRDVGHEVVKRFMCGDWEEIDRAYAAGELGSMAAYMRIAARMKVTREEMTACMADLSEMDPHFQDFYGFCRVKGIDVKIVSDGLDFYIDLILKRHGLDEIEFFSNVIRFHEHGAVSIEFPQHNAECTKCGTCKSTLIHRYRDHYDKIIYIGDGYSDVCPSRHADLVFGKDVLFERCRNEKRSCIYYRNFQEVRDILEKGPSLA